ncbi:MAG: aminotransferase class III-fold pyridoxal phosphate-dependent enzyme [Cyclobacteriaceae bacterium]
MKHFDVYPRYPLNITQGDGCYVRDDKNNNYLDFYGGHAVVSIGHNHAHYIKRITEQLNKIGFYSNSVEMPIQDELATKLGELSGYPDYDLFLCSSGAEANENAMKLASFHTGKSKFIVFEKGFHGRTSLAVEATDNAKIQAPSNHTGNIIRLPLNDIDAVNRTVSENDIAAIMIEGIQGVGGINIPDDSFLQDLRSVCDQNDALLILDEVQSGFGRTGKFFAHQYANIQADIISIAKGMGNGFPIGGVIISPKINAWPGMLGTTFGGNHLACAASLAVLEVIEKDSLIENTKNKGLELLDFLGQIEQFKNLRGRGLMIGFEVEELAKDFRNKLLFDFRIFTGSATGAHTIRLLPPLCIGDTEINHFKQGIHSLLNSNAAVSIS